jgi:TolA-binding protein
MYLKSNLIYYFFIILSLPFLVHSNENEDIKSDILFLKIQELESEIAELRNKIETQNFLIEKLLRESLAESNDYDSDNLETLTSNADIRFDGIDDPKSKDQIYSAAILALEEQTFDKAFNLFTYFVESFVDAANKSFIFLDSFKIEFNKSYNGLLFIFNIKLIAFFV